MLRFVLVMVTIDCILLVSVWSFAFVRGSWLGVLWVFALVCLFVV